MKLVICEKNISARNIAYILSGGNVKNLRFGKTLVYEIKKNKTIEEISVPKAKAVEVEDLFKQEKEALESVVEEEKIEQVEQKQYGDVVNEIKEELQDLKYSDSWGDEQRKKLYRIEEKLDRMYENSDKYHIGKDVQGELSASKSIADNIRKYRG